MTHTHTHTGTLTYAKSNWKKLGALKTGQAGAVGGPYGSVHIKTPRCHWRCPVMRAARRSSNFIGRIISNDNKAQESFRWKCRTSSVFHTRWMRLPRRRHSLFLCRPGLRSGARTLEHNSALRPEISALHSQGKEETERDFFSFFSPLLIMTISLFSSSANTQRLTGQHDPTVREKYCCYKPARTCATHNKTLSVLFGLSFIM